MNILPSGFCYSVRASVLQLLSPLLKQWRKRYRHVPTVTPDAIPEMDLQPLEGYTDKLFYHPGQTIRFFVHNEFEVSTLTLYRLSAPYTYVPVFETNLPKTVQKRPEDATENRLNWQNPILYTIPEAAQPGYYRATLTSKSWPGQSDITFLVGSATKTAKVAVLAPVSTWVAYNPYGGKSLYKNAHDGSSVYTVSTLRPNTALQYKSQENIHDVNVEANIFNWLQQHEGADLYPDFVLEQAPELLQKYKVVVLAYHVEYVSGKMYKNLRRLVNKQKLSLISLGANQIYWKVEWHDDFTRMECRKDASNFSKSGRTGGMWRHTSEPEAKLLGVCFTDAGMGTYAPYQVLQPNHWLYKDTQIQKGDLFGLSGINQIPVCGDETDKITFCSDSAVTVLAKGLNKKSVSEFEVYKQNDPEWNGAGGGCLVLKELSKKQAVLSTGSIQSGAGLGADAVFTKIVENFLERYA